MENNTRNLDYFKDKYFMAISILENSFEEETLEEQEIKLLLNEGFSVKWNNENKYYIIEYIKEN